MDSGVESGWQTGRTVLDCNRYMLEHDVGADVCFEIGSTGGATTAVEIRAHRYVLTSRSEVFEALFKSGMTECRNENEAKIRIEDIQPEIFRETLRFIYYEEAEVNCENATLLLYAAKKYLLPVLSKQCCDCLVKNLSASNAVNVLEHGLLFDETELIRECLRLISLNSETVLKGVEILSASKSTMDRILSLNLMASTELDVYEACVNWAKYRMVADGGCAENPNDDQIRETLGDLLYKIRFPTMDPVDFARLSVNRGVLSCEEKEAVYYYFVTKERVAGLVFSAEKRWGEEVFVDRTVSCITGNWKYSTPTVDAINFKADCGVLLTGVGLYPGHLQTGYDVDFEVLESSKSLFKRRTSVPHSASAVPWKVSLDRPIVIGAGVVYTIKAFAHDYIGFYGSPCEPVCSTGKVTITFTGYAGGADLAKTATNETYGQIPRLFFCQF